MKRALTVGHALLTAVLALWACWTFVALDRAFTQRFYLKRTMDDVVEQLPPGAAQFEWCVSTNPEAEWTAVCKGEGTQRSRSGKEA